VLSEADRSLLCQEMDLLLRTMEDHGILDPRSVRALYCTATGGG
jgi:hypothetical protein